MKLFTIIIILFFFLSCSKNNYVYWCGDHACVNNKERKAYFKETMIVEIKDKNKKSKSNSQEVKKIKKQIRLEKKMKKEEEKKLRKQAKLEEKIRIKEEKEKNKESKITTKVEKQIAVKKEKKIVNKEKKLIVKRKIFVENNTFDDILERIKSENANRPFPDINDLPK